MHKSTLIVLLALVCSPLTSAREGSTGKTAASTPASVARGKKVSAAEAATIEKFVTLQDAAIATFLELADTLRQVKDKESADAAAPSVKTAGEQLSTIIDAVEALGEPSEAAQHAIMSRVANVSEKNELAEQIMVPLLTLMMQAPPCYGSEMLEDEISALLANLQGTAGVEDDEGDDAMPATPLKEPDADETQETPGH